MHKLSPRLIQDAISLLHQNLSMSEIARRLSVSIGSIHNIKQKFVSNRVGRAPGRRRLLTDRQENLIVRKIASGQMDTAVDAAKSLQESAQLTVHPKTIRRVFR